MRFDHCFKRLRSSHKLGIVRVEVTVPKALSDALDMAMRVKRIAAQKRAVACR